MTPLQHQCAIGCRLYADAAQRELRPRGGRPAALARASLIATDSDGHQPRLAISPIHIAAARPGEALGFAWWRVTPSLAFGHRACAAVAFTEATRAANVSPIRESSSSRRRDVPTSSLVREWRVLDLPIAAALCCFGEIRRFDMLKASQIDARSKGRRSRRNTRRRRHRARDAAPAHVYKRRAHMLCQSQCLTSAAATCMQVALRC